LSPHFPCYLGSFYTYIRGSRPRIGSLFQQYLRMTSQIPTTVPEGSCMIAIPSTFLDWHVLVIFHFTISMFFFTNGLAKLSLCCNIIIRRETFQFIRKKNFPKTRKNRRQNLNHTLSQLANHNKGFKRRKQVGPHNYIIFLSRRPAKNLIWLGIYLDNNSQPLSNTIRETI